MAAGNDTTKPIQDGAGIRTLPRVHGFGGLRPVGALVPVVSRQAYRRHPPAAAQIILDWELIVGPQVAGMTVPRRLDRGVLTIACSGPTAMNLHYVGIELINRINTHCGGQPVHSLRFTQAGTPKSARATLSAPPEAVREAEAAVAELPDSPLKDALASLGRVVIGRTKHAKTPPAVRPPVRDI
jgi:hypothetical protein